MEFSFWKAAAQDRDRVVLVDPDGTEHTAGALLDASNQVARNLRALGCEKGDTVAMVLGNGVEVYEIMLGVMQAGIYLVPINWHLVGSEIAYILDDCEAKAVICSPELTDRVPDGERPVFVTGGSYAELRSGSTEPPEERWAGGIMNYTSGTTGRPKGVKRPLPPVPPEPIVTAYAMFLLMFGIRPREAVQLVGSPLYHTAVLYWSASSLHLGHKVVLMDKWTPQGFLERVEAYRVTCSHMVPTQFNRLLAFAERGQYDVSSLSNMVHGAAPCPPSVKREMLAWWGPVVYEYYAATEGGGTMVGPDEWLTKPGTVGKPWQGAEIAIFDDSDNRVGPNVIGTVYIKMQQAFEYHRDKEKTAKAHNTAGYFTVGDAGYLDEDGYLFLSDRKADMIISGGVNIYPAEIEAILVTHPAVLDVAVFGIPDEDWGEQVKAVIETGVGHPPSDALSDDILAYARERLAKFKCPKSIDFVDLMPRDPNGKLAKRNLRDPYWKGTGRSI